MVLSRPIEQTGKGGGSMLQRMRRRRRHPRPDQFLGDLAFGLVGGLLCAIGLALYVFVFNRM